MTPQIIARVDAWLAGRDQQGALGLLWGRLGYAWQRDTTLSEVDVVKALEAAMTGILLALVREAWGVPSLRCGHVGGWDSDWDTWQVDNPSGRGHGCCIKGFGATEADALLAALEAAPQ